MSGVNLMAIRQAEQPADERHPTVMASSKPWPPSSRRWPSPFRGWICVEAVRRLQAGSVVEKPLGGLPSWSSAWRHPGASPLLRRVAKATDSSALAADALHFAMDVYTNLALLLGLVILFWSTSLA